MGDKRTKAGGLQDRPEYRGEAPSPTEGLLVQRRHGLLSLLTAIALSGSLVAAGPTPASALVAGTSPAEYLVQRINSARADHGLRPLRVSADLAGYARAHSASMSGSRTLFHTSDFRVLCCWSAISENVAYDDTARAAHQALMRSPHHRANILDPSKRSLGVGVVRSGGSLWITQLFRRPS